MKQETSKSIIFLAIVGLVFVVSVVLIFQQELQFSRQLTASVFRPQRGEKQEEEEGGSQLIAKVVGQAKQLILSGCLDKADKSFEELWNQECEKIELQERCPLPRDVAEDLMDKRQQAEEECYKKYPVQ